MSIILVFATYLAALTYALKLEQQNRRAKVRVRSQERERNVIFMRQSRKVRPSYSELYRTPIADDMLPKKLKKDKAA